MAAIGILNSAATVAGPFCVVVPGLGPPQCRYFDEASSIRLGASVVYVSDTAPFSDILFEDQFVAQPPGPGAELSAADLKKLARMRDGVVRLCEGADLVVYDTMFTPEDYKRIPHFGHSRPSDALRICREAGARQLALFHHAPERSDAEVDAILAETQAAARRDGIELEIVAAYEGLDVSLGRR